MDDTKDTVKWFWVYFKIRRGLYTHFQNCKDKDINPGQELYQILNNSEQFKIENSWFEKFAIEDSFNCIDPIHVFASISSNRLSEKRRIIRIQILLKLLGLNAIDKSIDFDGCPTPTAIMLLGGRKKNIQNEIWSFFARIHLNHLQGLTKSDFDNYNKWHGIDFSSFTQFLFWFASNDFLPIEKNVRTFLASSKIVKRIPNKFADYKRLLEKIKKSEYEENDKYGADGLFREITHIAYQAITEGKTEITYTLSFHNWFLANKISDNVLISQQPKPIKKIEETLITQSESINTLDTEIELDELKEISKLGFKLIAIKPLQECSDSYLNILNKEEIYYFEKTIEIKDSINYFPERNLDLFSTTKALKLNFTAIVGKNGSGKSSIIELLFMAINNIAYVNRKSLNTDNLSIVKDLHLELYFINNGYLYKVTLHNTNIQWEEFELNKRKNQFIKIGSTQKFKKEFFDCFFYSIAVNYSHYALNSELLGSWVQGLFHKNDGYQTPLVINPMRTKGKIDINKENELVKSRLLSNLLLPVENHEDLGFRKLTDRQTAEKINLKFIPDKTHYIYAIDNEHKIVYYRDLEFDKDEIFNLILEVFNFSDHYRKNTPKVITSVKEYIIKKLIRIAVIYPQYSKFYDQQNDRFLGINKTKKYLENLKNDSSHVTFKLKQAINYWKYPLLWPKKLKFPITLKDQSEKIQVFMSEANALNINEFLAPPIFNFEILISDSNSKELVSFEKLSSGEKQFIHSASSILYHIKNIDSIQYQRSRVAYSMINVILDEIELYYHPELQRRYISDFIALLNRIDLTKIEAINFLLVTHSPYILSDIPDNFTMRLKDGNQQFDQQKTFGSNVHDLLANDFFMENGFMGEFAKKSINEIIQFLNYSKLEKELEVIISKLKEDSKNVNLITKKKIAENNLIRYVSEKLNIIERTISYEELHQYLPQMAFKDKEFYSQAISIIGEPVLRNKLRKMYNDVFQTNDLANKEKLLIALANELNFNLTKKN